MFPWKDFLMGQIRKIQKQKGGKGTDQENSKKQQGKNGGKKKKRFFNVHGGSQVPILVCSPMVENTLGPMPSCDPPPSGEPTHMGTSPTTY
jgi:hypothetical protein